ncbi:MAG TPA: hypothetical protein VJ579_02685 [Candidatus Paceibacterota bacterium]|nr:hypothetical protein [Candidatus Paceibacterota bacterium]
MTTNNKLALIAASLAPIKAKYSLRRHKEITMEDASLIKDFLGLMFIDCALVVPQRLSIVRGSREHIHATEVYFNVVNESGEQHEAAMLTLNHLLKENNGVRRLKMFFGMPVSTDEELLYTRLREMEKMGKFELPKIIKIDNEGNELLIDEADDEYCFDGTHRYCGGRITRHRTTNLHDVLVCDTCLLRVPFLHTIHTHEEFQMRK